MNGNLPYILIPVVTLAAIALAVVLALRKKGKRGKALQEFAKMHSYEFIGSVKHTLGRIAKVGDRGARSDGMAEKKHNVAETDIRIYDIINKLSGFGFLQWGTSSRRARNLFRIPDSELEQIVFDYSWLSGGRTTVAFETTVTVLKSEGISALPSFDVSAAKDNDSEAERYIEFASHPEFSGLYSVFTYDEDGVSAIRRVFSPQLLDFLMKTDSLFIQCRKDGLLIHIPKGGLMTVNTLWLVEAMEDNIKTTRRVAELLLAR